MHFVAITSRIANIVTDKLDVNNFTNINFEPPCTTLESPFSPHSSQICFTTGKFVKYS